MLTLTGTFILSDYAATGTEKTRTLSLVSYHHHHHEHPRGQSLKYLMPCSSHRAFGDGLTPSAA